MKNLKNMLWGIILVIIGIIVGTNALGITQIDVFFDGWWTLIIIIPCFIGLFSEKGKTGNIIGLFIGIALLLACQNILDFNLIWKLMLPLILIIIGISMIFKDSSLGNKVNHEIKKINEKQQKGNEYFATFSGQNLNFNGEKFTGTDLNAVFGGIKCDLRSAIIEQDLVINASSIFGGIDILVPENVKVKIKSSSIFGGVSDNRKNKTETEGTYTIYINATCLFGGVDVK